MTTTVLDVVGSLESLPRTEAEKKTSKESSSQDFQAVLETRADPGTPADEAVSPDSQPATSSCRCQLERINVWSASPPPPEARQFAFFLRISGNLADLGEGATGARSLFHESTQTLGMALRREPTWVGNPMGAYLNQTEDMFQQGPQQGTDYLQQVLLAAKQGLGQVQAGFLDFFGGGGDPASSPMAIPAPDWSTLTDTLDLSQTDKAGGLWRPLPHNGSGQVMQLVSSVTTASPVATTGSHTTPPRSIRILDRFLDLVESFLQEMASQESNTITEVSSTGETITPALDPIPGEDDTEVVQPPVMGEEPRILA